MRLLAEKCPLGIKLLGITFLFLGTLWLSSGILGGLEIRKIKEQFQ